MQYEKGFEHFAEISEKVFKRSRKVPLICLNLNDP